MKQKVNYKRNYKVSDRVFICNDEDLIFDMATNHMLQNRRNIAVFSNNRIFLLRFGEECSKSKSCKFNVTEMVVDFGFAKILLLPIDKERIVGIEIQKGFLVYDYDDLSYLKPFTKKILCRCRV